MNQYAQEGGEFPQGIMISDMAVLMRQIQRQVFGIMLTGQDNDRTKQADGKRAVDEGAAYDLVRLVPKGRRNAVLRGDIAGFGSRAFQKKQQIISAGAVFLNLTM